MKYLLNYKLFESAGYDDDIELFDDMLQGYFDEFKIYPQDEIDSQGMYGSTEPNGDYTIKRVSTNYFKSPGFPDHSKGILILVNLRRHDSLREPVSISLSSFIRRVQKMGYKVKATYDDTHTVKFYVAIIDKEIKESVRYLNRGFEVSEDDFMNWSYEHDLDPNGFSNRETEQLESWASKMNCKPLIYEPEYVGSESDKAKKSIVSLYDGYLRFDICKFKDEYFTLFIQEGESNIGSEQDYYLFETWEDLSERINKHLDNYLNYYSDENQQEYEEGDEEFESVEYAEPTNKIERISLDDYKQFTTKWKKSSLSSHDKQRFEKIFKVWSERQEINYKFREGELYLELGGRIFGKEVVVEKYEDDWYVINIIPRDAYRFATRNQRSYESYRQYYTCDQIDGVLEFLKQLDDKYTSNQDKTIFESKSTNHELCKEITAAQYVDIVDKHMSEAFTQKELEQITHILSITYTEVEMAGIHKNNASFEIWDFDDKKISISKFKDSWFLVEEEWSNSWNRDTRFYLCDELESIKYIDFYA